MPWNWTALTQFAFPAALDLFVGARGFVHPLLPVVIIGDHGILTRHYLRDDFWIRRGIVGNIRAFARPEQQQQPHR